MSTIWELERERDALLHRVWEVEAARLSALKAVMLRIEIGLLRARLRELESCS